MTEFFTWQTLATLSGASLATGLIVQFLKSAFAKLPTQILSYLVALAVLLIAAILSPDSAMADYLLCVFNAVIVAGTASNAAAFAQRMNGGA